MLRAHVCRRTVDVERVAPGVREGVVRGDRRTNIIPNSRSRGELVLPHAIRCPACQSLRSFDAHDLSFRARPSCIEEQLWLADQLRAHRGGRLASTPYGTT